MIRNIIIYPIDGMYKDEYMAFTKGSLYNFTNDALESYKSLTKLLESTEKSETYFSKLFTERMRFHNFLYGETILSNDTVNNVFGCSVSTLYFIYESEEATIKSEQNMDYLYYSIWNINNTLISTFEELLISLLEDIYLACDLGRNVNMIIYYAVCMALVLILLVAQVFITYCLWRKKNDITKLLLDINSKAYSQFKFVCEDILENLQVDV